MFYSIFQEVPTEPWCLSIPNEVMKKSYIKEVENIKFKVGSRIFYLKIKDGFFDDGMEQFAQIHDLLKDDMIVLSPNGEKSYSVLIFNSLGFLKSFPWLPSIERRIQLDFYRRPIDFVCWKKEIICQSFSYLDHVERFILFREDKTSVVAIVGIEGNDGKVMYKFEDLFAHRHQIEIRKFGMGSWIGELKTIERLESFISLGEGTGGDFFVKLKSSEDYKSIALPWPFAWRYGRVTRTSWKVKSSIGLYRIKVRNDATELQKHQFFLDLLALGVLFALVVRGVFAGVVGIAISSSLLRFLFCRM